MTLRAVSILAATFAVGGCSGVFESDLAAPQAYVLRLPPVTAPANAGTAGSVLVQRPVAGPGLDSERIVLLRSEQRFDFYAASRWAAPAPILVESLMLDAVRATGAFSAVLDDSAPFSPHYNLRCALRRFEADYSTGGEGVRGEGSGGAPTIFVLLDCTLGRHRDRGLLASFTAQGSAVAREDRLNAVVGAFEVATGNAMNELARAAAEAVARDPGASEGR
jgi:cholesterol transport system auxiliary component